MNGKSLSNFDERLIPDSSLICSQVNSFIRDETSCNRDNLRDNHVKWLRTLTLEQKKIYDQILEVVYNDSDGMFSIWFWRYMKDLLWKILGDALRLKG